MEAKGKSQERNNKIGRAHTAEQTSKPDKKLTPCSSGFNNLIN